MLVLTRKKNEEIVIGESIRIMVVEIRGDKVRLGITAPSHVPVHRDEIWRAIQEQNRLAAGGAPDTVATPQQP